MMFEKFLNIKRYLANKYGNLGAFIKNFTTRLGMVLKLKEVIYPRSHIQLACDLDYVKLQLLNKNNLKCTFQSVLTKLLKLEKWFNNIVLEIEEETVHMPAAADLLPRSTMVQLGTLNLNNKVVKTRKEVKRIQVLVTWKFDRGVGRLKSRKITEDALMKKQRGAQQLLKEIHAMMKPDIVTKSAPGDDINFEKICKKVYLQWILFYFIF